MFISLSTVTNTLRPGSSMFMEQAIIATFVRRHCGTFGHRLITEKDIVPTATDNEDQGELGSRTFLEGCEHIGVILSAVLLKEGSHSKYTGFNLWPYITRFFGDWETFQDEVNVTIGGYNRIVNMEEKNEVTESFYAVEGMIGNLVRSVRRMGEHTGILRDDGTYSFDDISHESFADYHLAINSAKDKIIRLLIKEQVRVVLSLTEALPLEGLLNNASRHDDLGDDIFVVTKSHYGDIAKITGNPRFRITPAELLDVLRSEFTIVDPSNDESTLAFEFPISEVLFLYLVNSEV